MIRILGIDPGSQRTGLGIIDVAADGRCSYVHAQALHLLEAIPPPQSDGWYMMYTATAGGYANLSLLLFFVVSTFVRWNGGRTSTTGPEHIV